MRVLLLLSALTLSFVGTEAVAQTKSPNGAVVKVSTQPKPKPIRIPVGMPWQVGVFY